MPAQHVFKFLRRIDGTRDLAVNGANVPQPFTLQGPARVERLLMRIADKGKLSLIEFGTLPELAKGITVQVKSGSDVVIDFLDGESLTKLADFSLLAGVDSMLDGDHHWHCRWTISKAGSWLKLLPDERLEFLIQDDISDLGEFYIMAQGT